ncbi:hypothetical protein Tco_0075362 [Tanacetum coccineum]
MAVKGTRKRSYESDDDLSVVSRPFKISCLEKVDEKTSAVNVERDYSDDEYVEEESCGGYEKGGSVTGDEGHEADDLLDQESCYERRRRLYAGDTYTDDEAEYSRYWDEALRSDDSKRVFVEQELSCEKGESCFERRRRLYAGDTYTDDEAEYSRYWDEALSSDDSKRVFVEQECSCEKSGNVTGDENVDEECSYGNSCDVAGKFSDNNGFDKAIYCSEGWFIGWSSE